MPVRLKEPVLVPEDRVLLRDSPIPLAFLQQLLTAVNGRYAVQCLTKAEAKHMSRKEVSGLGGIASLAMAGWQQLTFCELEAFGEPRAWEDSPLSFSVVSPIP